MSHPERKPTVATEDLTKAPSVDDAEHAEFMWLQARELDPGAPAPSSEIAEEHAELQALLGDVSSAVPGVQELQDQSWLDEVLKRADAPAPPPRPRRRPVAHWGIGAALVAAAAVVLMLYPRRPDRMKVAFYQPGETRGHSVRSKDRAVGEQLVITARPDGTAELRVFRSDGKLVAKCPNGTGCMPTPAGELRVEVVLDAPMQYRAILVVGANTELPSGPMDDYIDAARAAKAYIEIYGPIDVH